MNMTRLQHQITYEIIGNQINSRAVTLFICVLPNVCKYVDFPVHWNEQTAYEMTWPFVTLCLDNEISNE